PPRPPRPQARSGGSARDSGRLSCPDTSLLVTMTQSDTRQARRGPPRALSERGRGEGPTAIPSTDRCGIPCDHPLAVASRCVTLSPGGGYALTDEERHEHGQAHTHPHRHTKAVANQLARTAGHVTSIKRMVQEGRPCTDILIQLAAVRAAIDRTSRLVLEDHV